MGREKSSDGPRRPMEACAEPSGRESRRGLNLGWDERGEAGGDPLLVIYSEEGNGWEAGSVIDLGGGAGDDGGGGRYRVWRGATEGTRGTREGWYVGSGGAN